MANKVITLTNGIPRKTNSRHYDKGEVDSLLQQIEGSSVQGDLDTLLTANNYTDQKVFEIPLATPSNHGLMSLSDKAKVDFLDLESNRVDQSPAVYDLAKNKLVLPSLGGTFHYFLNGITNPSSGTSVRTKTDTWSSTSAESPLVLFDTSSEVSTSEYGDMSAQDSSFSERVNTVSGHSPFYLTRFFLSNTQRQATKMSVECSVASNNAQATGTNRSAPEIHIWNFRTNSWDLRASGILTSNSMQNLSFHILDAEPYVQDQYVYVRLRLSKGWTAGTDRLQVDYLALRNVDDQRVLLEERIPFQTFFKTNSTTYVVANRLAYLGRSTVGYSPKRVTGLGLTVNAATYGAIRIWDVTNSRVVHEALNVIYSPGSVNLFEYSLDGANFPAGKAHLEIQIRRSAGDKDIELHDLILEYW
jgi:hypothetical protein